MQQILKQSREQAGLSQKKLAEKCQMREQTYNLIEQGKSDPRFSTIQKICKALNLQLKIEHAI